MTLEMLAAWESMSLGREERLPLKNIEAFGG
jgi:hypothetical protein